MGTRLLNGKKLAKALDVPPLFVTAMKNHPDDPFRFEYGGRTILPAALEWLKAHPNFRYTDYIERHRKKPKTPPARPIHPREARVKGTIKATRSDEPSS